MIRKAGNTSAEARNDKHIINKHVPPQSPPSKVTTGSSADSDQHFDEFYDRRCFFSFCSSSESTELNSNRVKDKSQLEKGKKLFSKLGARNHYSEWANKYTFRIEFPPKNHVCAERMSEKVISSEANWVWAAVGWKTYLKQLSCVTNCTKMFEKSVN